jgi:purine-nucleoside phosphorylase
MDYQTFFPQVEEATKYLKAKIKISPKLLVVLTGGAEGFVKALEERQEFEAPDVPNYPVTRAEGHRGRIIFGKYEGLPLIAMQGRHHYYEGHLPQSVIFPYFVFERLGIQAVITTNAVGGINSTYNPGDIVVVKDHINLMGINPLIGIAVQREKDQFTSMNNAYDIDLRRLAFKAAEKQNVDLKEGVFVAVSGPSYETKSEIKAFRILGADTIGMSSVFEVIACKFLGLKVLTLNCVANPAADLHKGELKHEEVLRVVSQAQDKMAKLLGAIIKEMQFTDRE